MWKAFKKFIEKTTQGNNEEDKMEIDLFSPMSSAPSTDEVFATNFNAGGGHFLFCDNEEEALSNLSQIIQHENVSELICLDLDLQNYLDQIKIPYVTNPVESKYTLSFLKSEFLIAYDGSIMISSHQTFGRNIEDFPINYIIFATPSQLVTNVSEALQKLRSNKRENLPTNITCIRGKDMHTFNSIQNAKNIYLLLVDNL